MANKTLYVRDEDVEVWDKARNLIGDNSLSSFFTSHLKNLVADKEAEKMGLKKIILQFREKGKLPTAKAFYGRWLIPPEKPFIKKSEVFDDMYAVAITGKKNLVFFYFFRPPENGKFEYGRMDIYSSYEEALLNDLIPGELLAFVMDELGVKVEELDI